MEPPVRTRRRNLVTLEGRRCVSVGMAVAAAALAAGCTSGSGQPAHRSPAGPAQPDVPASYQAQQRARDQQATAYAQTLAGQVPRIAGERVLVGTPPASLAKPNETIGVPNLIVQARYWTVPGTPQHAYAALKRSAAPFRLTGYGRPGACAQPSGSGFLSYAGLPTPAYIQDAEIHVEIKSDRPGRSVIASFAEVDTHPVRKANEQISPTGAAGTFTWPRIERGRVVGHSTEPLVGAELPEVIREFNGSQVSNGPNVCFGALRLSGDVLTIRIRSAGDAWKLTYPGTSCADLAVVRDGQPLPAISPGNGFRQLLEVLSHDTGIVHGRLLLVGGPPGAAASPVPGTVSLSAGGRVAATARPRGSGWFSVAAQPGTYTLSGSSPQYVVDGVRGKCRAAHPLQIMTGRSVHADVYCERR